VIAGDALIVSVYGLVAVPPAASVRLTTTEQVHVTLGVPVITPVLAFIDMPLGRPLADHTYGVTPFVAAIAEPG
jgi:hypothetical protein